MKSSLIVLYYVFAAAFGFSLYLLACTASIDSNYQADIVWIRWFHPIVVLITFFVPARYLAQHRTNLQGFFLIALVESGAVFLLFFF